jgi:hypothetical protein
MLSKLCRTCQDIFQGACPHNYVNHHLYLYQLQQSAFGECFICVILWRAVSESRPPAPPQEVAEAPTHANLETGAEKPVSKYRLSHKSSRSSANPYKISELDFTVKRDGIIDGESAFTFCLQPLASKASPILRMWMIMLTACSE